MSPRKVSEVRACRHCGSVRVEWYCPKPRVFGAYMRCAQCGATGAHRGEIPKSKQGE